MDEFEKRHRARDIIAARIKVLKEASGGKLTQEDMEAASGVPQAVISSYMRGFIAEAKFGYVMKFLLYLGVDPVDLFKQMEE